MALLGFHLVLTLIAASVLQKVTARYSLGRWLLSGRLYRVVPPSDQELLKDRSSSKSGKAKRRQDNEPTVFQVPKQVDLDLRSASVSSLDVLQLPYYVEYRWMVDVSLFAFLVYGISEAYSLLFPVRAGREFNLSLVWLLLAIGTVLRALCSVTSFYFRGPVDTGERSVCLCFGAVSFLLTMILLMACGNVLDIDLIAAHRNFTESTRAFIQAQNIDLPTHDRSPTLLYLLVSVMFGVLACLLTFPSLRYARMYDQSIKYAQGKPLIKLLHHASFFSPLFMLLLWVKPLARDKLVLADEPLLTSDRFESLRLWTVLVTFGLRAACARPNLQSYLYTAHDSVASLKREAGRISNVDLKRLVNQPLVYLCVAAIQYYSTPVLLLSLGCLLKTCGQYSWLDTVPTVANSSTTLLATLFPVELNRAVWSFFLFATCSISFFLSVCGVVYTNQFKSA